MPNYVDPKILLWDPKLLWSKYLQVYDEWSADKDKQDLEIDRFESPEHLGTVMESFVKNPNLQFSKWKWETLFLFGWPALKRYFQWHFEQQERRLDIIGSGSQELGQAAGENPGMRFGGSIPPD